MIIAIPRLSEISSKVAGNLVGQYLADLAFDCSWVHFFSTHLAFGLMDLYRLKAVGVPGLGLGWVPIEFFFVGQSLQSPVPPIGC